MQPDATGESKTVDYVRAHIDRSQARSMVMSSRGIVASEHPLASQAGATILARGGHAVDAAIAANAVMGVVSPMMNGVGGDLFAIVHERRTGQLHGVNASGWAPAGLSLEFLRRAGLTSMPQSGIHSVTIPGAVAGWSLLLDRFGRKSFAEVLTSAIAVAEEGFPVSEIVADEWAASEGVLRSDSNATRHSFGPAARPGRGKLFRNPNLGWTYRQISDGGNDAFYRGEVARRLLSCSATHGGTIAAADLAEYEAEGVDPISTRYRGWDVYELPPNGQGIAALMMLNMLEPFPLRDYGHNSVEALHALIETKKLAYADMLRHVSDPRFAQLPVAGMLSKAYARDRAKLIDLDRASPEMPAGHVPTHVGDTTYLCVVDGEGNMVSLIQSVFGPFGSGLVPEGTGFALQSRGGLFTLDPTHPNALAPRKRPLHTIIPGFMSSGGRSHRLRHHGRLEPVTGACAVRLECRGPWPQYSGCARSSPLHQDHVHGLRRSDGKPIPEQVRTGLERKGHDIEAAGSFFEHGGWRPKRHAR